MEDADSELEALQALYGDEDCRIRRRWPPDIEILIRPRTAEDISQQFVEAVLAIRAEDQYPSSPPSLEIVSSKGLDEARKSKLLSLLLAETSELLNQPMLVMIAEAAAEFLTVNNYAAGDCCFCLEPLVDHSDGGQALSMMKLVSCFHCFHTNCFARWWTWLRSNKCKLPVCPICRAAVEDIGAIEQLVADAKTCADAEEQGYLIPDNLQEKQDEHCRVFEKYLAEQRARGGIIGNRGVIRPGMTVMLSRANVDVDDN